MTKRAQPYTQADLERGEQLVRRLHGVQGFDAWAELLAQALAEERNRAINAHENQRAQDAAIF